MANQGPNLNASSFFITLTNDPLEQFNKKHTIFGVIAEEESFSVLDKINKVFVN